MSKTINNIKILAREFITNKENSICDAFIYNPINMEENKLGNLFIVGEIICANREEYNDTSYIINQTATRVKKEYYGNTKRNPHDSFEESVKKANLFLAEVASEKKFFNIKNLNFIISSFSDQNFYFTACGTPKIFLLRENNLMDIEKKLLLPKKTSPSKVFVNIANGKLIKKDLLLLINSEFANLFSPIVLKTIMSNNNLNTVYEYISKTIKSGKSSCGMIMLNAMEEKTGPVVRYSYEELKKMSGNADIVIDSSAPQYDETRQTNRQAHLFFSEKLKNILRFLTRSKIYIRKIYAYIEKFSLIFIKWVGKNIVPRVNNMTRKLPIIKNPKIRKIIKSIATNKINLIIFLVVIAAIIIFISYLLKKETTYLIK